MEPLELSDLMDRARAGDEAAWNEIVQEFGGLLLAVVRGFRLGQAQSADVVQTTWLRLVEHLDQVRDPARLCGWLRTTAFRACLEVLRESRRELPVDPCEQQVSPQDRYVDADHGRPDERLLLSEREVLVRRAVAGLPARQQLLLSLLLRSPALSYEDISARLDMPIGSIGPTRARILRRLRAALETADFSDLALG
jgi:RNA polymerase sigma factor (sigma-70 family)